MSTYNPAVSPVSYRWYVVAALSVVLCFSIMDRSLLNILQEPIKKELHLKDGQLGLLTGLAFAIFYGTLAVPIARFADRSNRTWIVCGALALWSLMTAGCGIATTFTALFLCRMGVGVGEAGGYPTAASILTDYFEKQKRATALAVFGAGAPLGTTVGLFAGGWLSQSVGWRNAFLIVGVAGLLLAPLVLLTVREPKRGGSDKGADALHDAASANFMQVAAVLWRLKTIRYLYLANMAQGFVLYAYNAWSPPFYSRIFHLPTGQIALALGLLSLLGALGTLVGGFLADRLGKNDIRWSVWVLAAASALAVPAAIAQFMATDLRISLALAAAPPFLLSLFIAPSIAAGQTLVLPHMRATSAAVMLMTFNIFGLGLGPLLVGVLSDFFTDRLGLGAEGLRYALVVGMLFALIAVFFYLLSGRAIPLDSARDKSMDFAHAPRKRAAGQSPPTET